MSFYRERFGHRDGEFPVCEDVAARSLALPFFPELSEGAGRRGSRETLRELLSASSFSSDTPPGSPLSARRVGHLLEARRSA